MTLQDRLLNIEVKLDHVHECLHSMKTDLEVHKVKTGRFSVLLGFCTSVITVIMAFVLKGCV